MQKHRRLESVFARQSCALEGQPLRLRVYPVNVLVIGLVIG